MNPLSRQDCGPRAIYWTTLLYNIFTNVKLICIQSKNIWGISFNIYLTHMHIHLHTVMAFWLLTQYFIGFGIVQQTVIWLQHTWTFHSRMLQCTKFCVCEMSSLSTGWYNKLETLIFFCCRQSTSLIQFTCVTVSFGNITKSSLYWLRKYWYLHLVSKLANHNPKSWKPAQNIFFIAFERSWCWWYLCIQISM